MIRGWRMVVCSDVDLWNDVRAMTPPRRENFEFWPEQEKDDW